MIIHIHVDAWWYKGILQPFFKEAIIKCLRSVANAKFASNEQMLLSRLLLCRTSRQVPLDGLRELIVDGI